MLGTGKGSAEWSAKATAGVRLPRGSVTHISGETDSANIQQVAEVDGQLLRSLPAVRETPRPGNPHTLLRTPATEALGERTGG